MPLRHQHRKRRPLYSLLQTRQLGDNVQEGDLNRTCSSLFSNFQSIYTWDPTKSDSCHHGGIFNFDFSPNGSLLAAACEGHSVLLFDPFSHKLVKEVNKAHDDCVNCVRFLDSRLLATCSDDNNVALWDIRYLKTRLHLLCGHTNWVKNIEYASDCGKLVTSGFDGNIFTWDINSYCDGAIQGQKVFSHKMLMRSKLSPDGSKLIVSTQEGKIILINNLDLNHLAEDMKEFLPQRLFTRRVQRDSSIIRNRKQRNYFEMINDWPMGNGAGDIASIQVHPQGWCVLSRNVSRDYKSEWTCVHDIQDYPDTEEDMQEESDSSQNNEVPVEESSNTDINPTSSVQQNSVPYLLLTSELDSPLSPGSETSNDATFGTVERQTLANGFHPQRISVDNVSNSETESSSDETEGTGLSLFNNRSLEILSMIGAFEFENGEPPLTFHQRLSGFSLGNRDKTRNRLLHYIEEPNVGRGFIKELCFSNDGRLVCSPFGYGVRLLSFDPDCSELCDIAPMSSPGQPLRMYEVENCLSHSNVVVTCKFSPQHCMFVSGCLSGKVAFHQPVL
ncbi:DDB1- and CUL4-associated factor 10-like [Mytilus edulis]|uniref:DCAF10 n=1 Tax=Mytilus edulis TaxID=6550 RepID=A0A8S3UD96_MYTED|nr:DCAF10 [Mytilus edulis]